VNAYIKKSLVLSAIASLFIAYAGKPASATNFVDLGNARLQQRDYKAACDYYKSELFYHQNNAAAHYGLGYAYLYLNRTQAAQDELRLASELDPSGSVGSQARQALAALSQKSAVKSKNLATPPLGASVSKLMVQSEKRVTGEEALREGMLEKELEDKIKTIKADCQSQVNSLETELQRRLSSEGGELQTDHAQRTITGSRSSLDLQLQYQKRIADVQAKADSYIEATKKTFEAKRTSLQTTREMLNSAYHKQNNNPDLKLVPLGTNTYARSYETNSDASGNPVPLIAQPSKLPAKPLK